MKASRTLKTKLIENGRHCRLNCKNYILNLENNSLIFLITCLYSGGEYVKRNVIRLVKDRAKFEVKENSK